MPCIAFSASSFELYGPPMFFMLPVMHHGAFMAGGIEGHIELLGEGRSAKGDNKRRCKKYLRIQSSLESLYEFYPPIPADFGTKSRRLVKNLVTSVN